MANPTEFDIAGAQYYAVAPAGYSYNATQDTNYDTRKYNTLSAAVAAVPSTLVEDVVINIIGDWTGITDPTRIDILKTTTADYRLTIRAIGTARHNGVWSDSDTFYRLKGANSPNGVIHFLGDNITLDGIIVEKSTNNGNDRPYIKAYVGYDGSTNALQIVKNCIVKGFGGSDYREIGIDIYGGINATQSVCVFNCIVFNLQRGGGDQSRALDVDLATNPTANIYSCTLIGTWRGLSNSSGGSPTVNVKNCYASCNTSGTALAYSSTGSYNSFITCASSDDTGSEASLTGIATGISTFTDPDNGDFSLPVGSPLRLVGTDTSAEPAPLDFDCDIEGKTR